MTAVLLVVVSMAMALTVVIAIATSLMVVILMAIVIEAVVHTTQSKSLSLSGDEDCLSNLILAV